MPRRRMARQTVKGCTSKPNSSPYSLGVIWGGSEIRLRNRYRSCSKNANFLPRFFPVTGEPKEPVSRYRCINRRKNAVETEYLSATSAVVSPDSRAPNMRFRRSIDVMAAIIHPWHNKFQLMMVYKVATLLGWAL